MEPNKYHSFYINNRSIMIELIDFTKDIVENKQLDTSSEWQLLRSGLIKEGQKEGINLLLRVLNDKAELK